MKHPIEALDLRLIRWLKCMSPVMSLKLSIHFPQNWLCLWNDIELVAPPFTIILERCHGSFNMTILMIVLEKSFVVFRSLDAAAVGVLVGWWCHPKDWFMIESTRSTQNSNRPRFAPVFERYEKRACAAAHRPCTPDVLYLHKNQFWVLVVCLVRLLAAWSRFGFGHHPTKTTTRRRNEDEITTPVAVFFYWNSKWSHTQTIWIHTVPTLIPFWLLFNQFEI